MTTPPDAAGDLVDSDLLREHVDLLGGADLIGLVRLFRRTSRTLVEELSQAATCGDRLLIASLAHRLRSAAGQLGLTELANRAAAAEARASEMGERELDGEIAKLWDSRWESLKALGQTARRLKASFRNR